MKTYSKFQMGWILVLILSPFIIFSYWVYKTQWGNNPISLNGFILQEIIFGVILLLFYGMKVTVSDTIIRITYGIGLISIKIKTNRIKSTEIVRNPWYYGLGIRFTPTGMLYNIHGRNAVELKLNDSGRTIRIGSADCENLKMAINGHLSGKV
jgi:hypothetical protein